MLKKLAQTIDKVDEDRYDSEAKVKKTDKEVEYVAFHIVHILETYSAGLDYVLTHPLHRSRT
jgi:hypothetical protein